MLANLAICVKNISLFQSDHFGKFFIQKYGCGILKRKKIQNIIHVFAEIAIKIDTNPKNYFDTLAKPNFVSGPISVAGAWLIYAVTWYIINRIDLFQIRRHKFQDKDNISTKFYNNEQNHWRHFHQFCWQFWQLLGFISGWVVNMSKYQIHVYWHETCSDKTVWL